MFHFCYATTTTTSNCNDPINIPQSAHVLIIIIIIVHLIWIWQSRAIKICVRCPYIVELYSIVALDHSNHVLMNGWMVVCCVMNYKRIWDVLQSIGLVWFRSNLLLLLLLSSVHTTGQWTSCIICLNETKMRMDVRIHAIYSTTHTLHTVWNRVTSSHHYILLF